MHRLSHDLFTGSWHGSSPFIQPRLVGMQGKDRCPNFPCRGETASTRTPVAAGQVGQLLTSPFHLFRLGKQLYPDGHATIRMGQDLFKPPEFNKFNPAVRPEPHKYCTRTK